MVVLYLLSKSLSRADCLQHYKADTKNHISAVRSHVSNIRLLRNTTLACVNAKLKTNFRRIWDQIPIPKSLLEQSLNSASSLKLLLLVPHWNGIRTYPDKFFYWDPDFHHHPYIYICPLHPAQSTDTKLSQEAPGFFKSTTTCTRIAHKTREIDQEEAI